MCAPLKNLSLLLFNLLADGLDLNWGLSFRRPNASIEKPILFYESTLFDFRCLQCCRCTSVSAC